MIQIVTAFIQGMKGGSAMATKKSPGNAVFYSGINLLKGDYDCLVRNENVEPYTSYSYHDFYEFQIFFGKTGRIEIGEKKERFLVQRGDLLFIDMFTPHALITDANAHYERFSISISASLLISMCSSSSNLLSLFHYSDHHFPVVHIPEDRFEKYDRLLSFYRNYRADHGQDIFDRSVIHQFLAFAYNDCWTADYMEDFGTQRVRIISVIINYINQHLQEELTLAKLAKEVSYSEYYVSRIFKEMTGKTLSAYIQEKRIGEAARMLRAGSPVTKAAESVGFNNYSYFYKTFLRKMGMAPKAYRTWHMEHTGFSEEDNEEAGRPQ